MKVVVVILEISIAVEQLFVFYLNSSVLLATAQLEDGGDVTDLVARPAGTVVILYMVP